MIELEIARGNLRKAEEAQAQGYNFYCPTCRNVYRGQECKVCGGLVAPIENLIEEFRIEAGLAGVRR